MTTTTQAFVPGKETSLPQATRQIEQWQLDHEGVRFVTSEQLNATAVRGANVFNTDDGLYYVYDGTSWAPRPGQLLRAGGFLPVSLQRTTNSPQSADAGHDVGISATLDVPVLGGVLGGARVLLQVSTPGFIYAVDPGANAVFQIQITDNANNVLVAAESHFLTGQLKAPGVTAAKWFVDNTILTAGTFGVKVRVASTDATQSYGTLGSGTGELALTFEAWVY